MTEAWRVRRYQQQQLIEKLLKRAWDFEEKNDLGHEFYFDLALDIISFIKSRLNRTDAKPPVTLPRTASMFLYSEVWSRIDEFSRTPEECNFLLGKFLSKAIGWVLHPINLEMLGQEVHEPEKIYGAPAMAEVPIPDEEDDL